MTAPLAHLDEGEGNSAGWVALAAGCTLLLAFLAVVVLVGLRLAGVL
jgi:hypothetical protein